MGYCTSPSRYCQRALQSQELLNYLVVFNKKFSFVILEILLFFCSSVPVVVLCELFFSETFLDKFRLYYVSECRSSIVSLESVIF